MDFTIEDDCYVNDKFIGTTVSKKITVNILNPDNSINLENKEIEAYAGINDEFIPFGNFIIQKPENQEVKEKTSFTGYDYMIKFNTLYKNSVTYPCKLSELFIDICSQVGLEAGNTDFTNNDYMILGNPFTNNEDCRTVLSNIAQLAGGFSKIGRDNKVYIKTLKNISNLLKVKDVNSMTVKELNLTPIYLLSGEKDNADEQLDGNNYFNDFSKNEQWGELNSLVLGLSSIEGENTSLDDKDSIQENGITEITIEDNCFLIDQTEREKVIEPLWNSLKGIKYLPFKTNYYGYPYLDAGDMIYILDTKDTGYVSYVFNHTFKFNGGFSGSIETPALTKTQTSYKNTTDVKTKFLRTERKIDKINGIIEDIIEETSENTEKLSQHEQTIDSMKDTLKSQETKIETIESKADTAQSTADTATTKANNAQTSANNAQSTANTANTNAQNAQKTANSNTTKITTTITKLAEVEKTVDGITQSVSAVEEKVETVETKADTAQSTADTATTKANNAQSTADKVNTSLTTNYYTKTETNSQIQQKADSITSTVSKTYSTKTETANIKTEAINSANTSTDNKLKDYTVTSKLGTFIEQNYEHVKIAWNQISEFIQMMIINNNASLAILDENKNVMMALDKKGQHFYKSDGTTIFAEMGVHNVDDNNYIAFSIPTNYNESINDGMAWGVTTTSDKVFHPILYIKNFTMPPKNSGGCTGELQLDGCNLVLGGENGYIISNGIKITPEALGGISFLSQEDDSQLLTIINNSIIGKSIYMFDNICFGVNQAGSNTFKIGDNSSYCLFTDVGDISCTGDIICNRDITCKEYLTAYNGISCTNGYVSGIAFINNSKLENKKNIKKYEKNAINEIMKTDIYEFNYKSEEDGNKKHIGFIIGGDYKHSSEITAQNKEKEEIGSDIYSMVSVSYKAIQEQQKQIEQLQEKDKQKDEIIADLMKRIEILEKD